MGGIGLVRSPVRPLAPVTDFNLPREDRDAVRQPEAAVDTEIASAINVAILQAQETYRQSMDTGIAKALREEVRLGFQEMLKAINDIVRPTPPPVIRSQAPTETASAESGQQQKPHQGAIPKSRSTTKPPPKPPTKPERSTTSSGLSRACEWEWRNPGPDQRQRENNRSRNIRQSSTIEGNRGTANHRRPNIEHYSGRPWVKMDKWEVSFDGSNDRGSVEDFVFKVEYLKRQFQCPWDEILSNFHVLVKGRAREWYWLHVRQRPIYSWDELRKALFARFRGSWDDVDRLQEMRQRQQLPGESVNDFIQSMTSMASRLEIPLPEPKLIKLIKKGLRDSVGRYIYAMDVYSVDHLREECNEVESSLGQRGSRLAYGTQAKYAGPGKNVSAICDDLEEKAKVEPEVDEIRVKSSSSRTGLTQRVKKARERCTKRRLVKRQVVESVKRGDNRDSRVFAEVSIEGKQIAGLLDTGASVSILGRGSREFLAEINVPMQRYVSSVRTASGEDRSIIGRVHTRVTYGEKEEDMTFYICPYLEQPAYLGIDFWRVFGLAPDVLGSMEAQISEESKPNLVEAIEHYVEEKTLEPEVDAWELDEEQKSRLETVKAEFLSFENAGLGKTTAQTHKIELIEGAIPVKDRHYPLSPAMEEVVWGEVDKMLALGVIEESDSPWSNRITIVRRPDKNRFCLDARKLNAVTVKDAYPLPSIEGILSRIDQTYYISSVDLKFAFWQIELDESSKAYTAFTVPGRPLYQFVVMPFGLCNAAQRLCRLMDRVIPSLLRSNVFVYLDDLLIIAPDFNTHMKYLGLVAQKLKEANLTIGLKKSKFCFKSLKYLGFIVGGGTLRTDQDRVIAIQRIPNPKSAKEVRSFLGTAGWYRRFIKNFAEVAAPLTDTLKGCLKGKFKLSDEAEKVERGAYIRSSTGTC
ncbi:uncharacterized protein LOC122322577 [Drosophila grimshawi]|uniref:uncharacterized protein LOC122322577 n=1 Tax=Drosophila grimshawi TaxID=7222 RepID=UPI001C932026|nr:uncharacterized protein LOC122322577 [Drosophila grimshawi]